eukprot:3941263-Rhodomonas_salina.3
MASGVPGVEQAEPPGRPLARVPSHHIASRPCLPLAGQSFRAHTLRPPEATNSQQQETPRDGGDSTGSDGESGCFGKGPKLDAAVFMVGCPTWLRAAYAMSGTHTAICLRRSYAVPGTGVAYGGTAV